MIDGRAGGVSNALVLAGGASSRMGRPKALLGLRADDGGPTFLEAIVQSFQVVGLSPIVVVTGAWPLPMPPGAVEAHAADWADGMRASLRAGLRALPPGPVLLTHVDRPVVAPATLRALLAVGRQPGGVSSVGRQPGGVSFDPCVVPHHHGEPGHPVRLSAAIRARLTEADNTPLDRLLSQFGAVALPVDDPGVLFNVNTPGDLETLRRQLGFSRS